MYIGYKDLEIEQKKDLDYKISKAVEAVASGLAVCKHRPAIAFSGGKDSTVLWYLIRTYFPEWAERFVIIYGNTGVEYPECVKFARQLKKDWKSNFQETKPERTEKKSLKYPAQQKVLQYLIDNDKVQEVLKDDGKLKTTGTLEAACPGCMYEEFEEQGLIWPEGTRKSYWWCVDQYGWPLLGKAFSKLKAHRINIDCFLNFSQSQSEDPKLLAYYDILKQVKISQACCDVLKKEPSEKLQAEWDVDVIFKGLMASESRSRQTNFMSRGYLFESKRPHLEKSGDSFWHCNPISIWTDDDIWAYIHRFNVPYSDLYNMGWTDESGKYYTIKRNGCMGCGTDLLYKNNHMAMLRRTHNKQWRAFMELGMAEQIKALQIAKRNGVITLFDMLEPQQLLEMRPCIFDRVDKLILKDDTWVEEEPDFDPDVEDGEAS
jgi:3'-phosphoadenosine 5'-phosphosulfate sulfotransferase (PAPS reductase)/FAD synthetase